MERDATSHIMYLVVLHHLVWLNWVEVDPWVPVEINQPKDSQIHQCMGENKDQLVQLLNLAYARSLRVEMDANLVKNAILHMGKQVITFKIATLT